MLGQIGVILILSVFTCSDLLADGDVDVSTNNGWTKRNNRSIGVNLFQAWISNDCLYIECNSNESDLFITITNDETSEVVYTGNHSKYTCNQITISLKDLERGSYTLLITNNKGGEAYGQFNK
jgi:hypothetical protein